MGDATRSAADHSQSLARSMCSCEQGSQAAGNGCDTYVRIFLPRSYRSATFCLFSHSLSTSWNHALGVLTFSLSPTLMYTCPHLQSLSERLGRSTYRETPVRTSIPVQDGRYPRSPSESTSRTPSYLFLPLYCFPSCFLSRSSGSSLQTNKPTMRLGRKTIATPQRLLGVYKKRNRFRWRRLCPLHE